MRCRLFLYERRKAKFDLIIPRVLIDLFETKIREEARRLATDGYQMYIALSNSKRSEEEHFWRRMRIEKYLELIPNGSA